MATVNVKGLTRSEPRLNAEQLKRRHCCEDIWM